jgi:hypothetical protein
VFASRRVVNFCAFAAVAKIHINSPPGGSEAGTPRSGTCFTPGMLTAKHAQRKGSTILITSSRPTIDSGICNLISLVLRPSFI